MGGADASPSPGRGPVATWHTPLNETANTCTKVPFLAGSVWLVVNGSSGSPALG